MAKGLPAWLVLESRSVFLQTAAPPYLWSQFAALRMPGS
jgi:hypothetical protein